MAKSKLFSLFLVPLLRPLYDICFYALMVFDCSVLLLGYVTTNVSYVLILYREDIVKI